jgi:hypothetical protein
MRHPVRTAASLAGFAIGAVSGTAQVASGLVRSTPPGSDTMPLTDAATAETSSPTPTPTPPASVSVPVPDLPEPEVITGDEPTAAEVHHEPKAASRGSAHGLEPGDVEEAGQYVDEIAGATDGGADVLTAATQPVSADAEPLIEPGSGSAARKEAVRSARAADPRPD